MNEDKKLIRVLLVGYIGGINVGDEAIVGAVLNCLIDNFDVDVSIVSGQPELTKNYLGNKHKVIKGVYPGAQIKPKQLYKLVKKVFNTDVVLFVGGGLLQDVHSSNLLTHCALMALLGKLFSTKVGALGIGVGPVKTDRGKELSTLFLNAIDVMTVRDEGSSKYISTNFNSQSEKIVLGSDSIYLLSERFKNKKSTTISNRIGLCFRDWPGLDIAIVLNLVEDIILMGKTPVFFAYEKRDIKVYNLLNEKFPGKVEFSEPKNIAKTIGEFNKIDGLVSMRLHANLFAIMRNIPFVALSYDEKVKNVISEIGYSNKILPLSADSNDILSKIDIKNNNIDGFSENIINNNNNNNFRNLESILDVGESRDLSYFEKLPIIMSILAIINRVFVLPRIQSVSIFFADKIGFLFPKSIKNKLRVFLGLEW